MSDIGLTEDRDTLIRENIPSEMECPSYGQKTIVHVEIQTRFAPELELEISCAEITHIIQTVSHNFELPFCI